MEISREQEIGLMKFRKWYNKSFNNDPLFRLFGYAGTGKTEMAQYIAANANGTVKFAAFTGKAASVLRSKGCVGASTIHSLVYLLSSQKEALLLSLSYKLDGLEEALAACATACEDPDREGYKLIPGEDMNISVSPTEIKERIKELKHNIMLVTRSLKTPDFVLNPESELRKASLLIVDECSMVDEIIALDLLSFGTKILVLGDPAQLPPVKGRGYFINHKPDHMLTEIHRQAKDDPIVHLSFLARKGKKIDFGTYGETRVIHLSQLDYEQDYKGVEMVLCGRNKTRQRINRRIRKMLGFKGNFPVKNEQLVCLKNSKDHTFLNGMLFICGGSHAKDAYFNKKHPMEPPAFAMDIILDVVVEETDEVTGAKYLALNKETYAGVSVWKGAFLMTNKHIKSDPSSFRKRMGFQEFDWGYCLTVHKSQGSQWNSVTLCDDGLRTWGEPKEKQASLRRKWLYTGITRAATKLTLVR